MMEPLVPADADVRGFKDMPVEVSRLLSSETWIMCTPEERSAAINLWFHSWMQVPAGSLPDNDRVLAHLSMASEKWPEVKDMALRGWVKADDGRLYHPVVCEKVGAMLAVRARKVDAGRKGGSISKPAKTKKKIDPEATAKHQLNGSQATAKLQPSYSQAPFPSPPIHKLDNDDNARARLDRMEADLREAAGEALDPTSTGLMVLDRPHAWARDGCDFDLDVLPAIRAASARASPQSIRSWKYFDRAVADAKARRMKPTPEGVADERSSPDTRARENHLAGIREALAARSGGAGG